MGNHLSRYEQEVHISFNLEEKVATCYTSSPRHIEKLDKLVEKYPEYYKCVDVQKIDGEIVSKTYEYPSKFVKWFNPRILTDEQRQALRDRFAKTRQNNN